MVSLARKNLLNDIPRFLVAQAGIMFAVSLVTLQTGIFNGFTRSTGQLMYNSDADIWVSSDTLVQLEMTLPIPVSYVLDARKIEGVAIAEPLIFSGALWKPPQGEITRARIIGFDIKGQLFTPVNLSEGSLEELKKPYTLIVDKKNKDSLSIKKIGDKIQVNSFPAQVVGFTEGNKSIVSNAFTFMTLETANTILTSGQTSSVSCQLPSKAQQFSCTNSYTAPSDLAAPTTAPPPPNKLVASDLITYVLIKVKPGEDIEKLKKKLEASLPNTRAYSRQELLEKNETFWQKRTGVGFVLGLGAAVGVIVGIIIVGQILYSSVLDHLKEFGTLKAIGASDWTIYGVIIEQALWMSVFGYIPGMVLCYGVAYWAFATQGILILITPVSAIAVLGITVGMCVGSAIFAIQKVTKLDPAMVFKA